MANSAQDQWAQWLLERRHGGDAEKQKAKLESLYLVRDKELHNTRLAYGDTLLDVGCGDGLIAFGALPIVGERGKVIFSDISQGLLDHCRSLARQVGMLDRCRFVRAPADDFFFNDTATTEIYTFPYTTLFRS